MVFPKKEAPTSGAAGSALNNLVTFSLWQIILRMQEKLGNMAIWMVLPYASITPQHDIYCSFCNYVMLFMHEVHLHGGHLRMASDQFVICRSMEIGQLFPDVRMAVFVF